MGTLLLVALASLGLITITTKREREFSFTPPRSKGGTSSSKERGVVSEQLQSLYAQALRTMPYAGKTDAARSGWKTSGMRDKWVKEFYAAVSRVASEKGWGSHVALFVTAHACWSSGWGRSVMTRLFKNAFGMKAGPGYTGYVIVTSPESHDTQRTPIHYQVFETYEDCIRAHLALLSVPRYRLSLAKLKAGDMTYGGQLGADGWYDGQTPEEGNQKWLSYVAQVRSIMAK